jgi:hypothetical protein
MNVWVLEVFHGNYDGERETFVSGVFETEELVDHHMMEVAKLSPGYEPRYRTYSFTIRKE